MERKQHIPVFIGCAVLLLLLLTVVFVLFFSPKDVSANHSGSQRLFGATYMTMTTPTIKSWMPCCGPTSRPEAMCC